MDFEKLLNKENVLVTTTPFSKVYRINCDEQTYAMKVYEDTKKLLNIPIDDYIKLQDTIKNKLTDINECIVNTYQICSKDGILYMIQEWYDYTLEKYLSDSRSINDNIKARLDIASSIIECVSKIHARGVIHADVRPENIALSELAPSKFRVRIADFDRSCVITDELQKKTSPTKHESMGVDDIDFYRAPEYNDQQSLTTYLDIYSVSAIVLELFYGRTTKETIDQYKNESRENSILPQEVFSILWSNVSGKPGDRESLTKLAEALSEYRRKLCEQTHKELKEQSERRKWAEEYEKAYQKYLLDWNSEYQKYISKENELNSEKCDLEAKHNERIDQIRQEEDSEHRKYKDEKDKLNTKIQKLYTTLQSNIIDYAKRMIEGSTIEKCHSKTVSANDRILNNIRNIIETTQNDVDVICRNIDQNESIHEERITRVREKSKEDIAEEERRLREKTAHIEEKILESEREYSTNYCRLEKDYKIKRNQIINSIPDKEKENILSNLDKLFRKYDLKAISEDKYIAPFNESQSIIQEVNFVYIPEIIAKYNNIYIISDLHGDYESLFKSLEYILFYDNDSIVIFLGDYGDRGPSTLRVLLCILELKARFSDRIVLLKGNHEELEYSSDVTQGQPSITSRANPSEEYINAIQFIDDVYKDKEINAANKIVTVLKNLPNHVYVADGTLVTHGFVLPPLDETEYSGKPTEEQKTYLTVQDLDDVLQGNEFMNSAMRWRRFSGKDEIIFYWPSGDTSSVEHWHEFRKRTGIKRIIRGHDPVDGSKVYENAPDVLTLSTSMYLSNCNNPSIAKLQWDKMPEVIRINCKKR